MELKHPVGAQVQEVLTVALVVEQDGIAGGERVGHPEKSASAPTPIVEMTMPITTTQTMILTKLSFRILEMLDPYSAIRIAFHPRAGEFPGPRPPDKLPAVNLMRLGITRVFRGLREGDTAVLLGGVLLALLGWRRRPVKRKQVTRITIKPGEAKALRVTAKGREPIRFER